MISKEAHDMVRLTSAANPFEAHIWGQALMEVGVHSQVLGDYLGGGIGNIPGMRAEIWVEATDLERAEAILCLPTGRAARSGGDRWKSREPFSEASVGSGVMSQ